jgi:hypothetical protein
MRPAALPTLVAVAVAAGLLAGCGRPKGAAPAFTVVTDSLLAPPQGGGTLRLVRLRDPRGTVHEAWLRLPPPETGIGADSTRHVPVVILGGIGTGRRAATLVPCPPGYALVALDYPYAGPRAPTREELVRAVPEIHRAAHATPHGVAATIAWLRTRADMDRRGALVVGASFGVPFVLRGLALLPRERGAGGADHGPAGVRAVCLLYGGADLPNLVRYRMRDRPGWEREAAAWGLALLFPDLEPGRWIGRVAPKPLLFINGRRDELVGEGNARLLHARAGGPKTVVWIDSEHMRPEADALLVDLVERARRWFEELPLSAADSSAGASGRRPRARRPWRGRRGRSGR